MSNEPLQLEPCTEYSSLNELISYTTGRKYSFLLESAGGYSHCRWSFAGYDPVCVLAGDLNQCRIFDPGNDETLYEGGAFSCLSSLLDQQQRFPRSPDIPFIGGGVGFFSFDCGQAFEELPREAERDRTLPHLYWAFYDTVYAFDHHSEDIWIVHSDPHFDQFSKLRRSRKENRNDFSVESSLEEKTVTVSLSNQQANMTRGEYIQAVQSAKQYIEEGEVYQVNLSRRMTIPNVRAPQEVYRRLRAVNPAPYMAYLRGDDLAVLSSSPEQFLKVRGHEIQTRPIKGTRPRHSDSEKDRQLKQALMNSTKDRAELHMVVDLERNDLGRICRYGSVKTRELHCIESFSSVHHLVGTVEGTLREGTSIRDILRAMFPGGSISGVPKIRALEIIDELEPTRRQVYTGAVGWIGWNGDLEWNIPIRTMEWDGEDLWYQVGGGIVADSDPEKEFRETRNKAQGMQQVFQSSAS